MLWYIQKELDQGLGERGGGMSWYIRNKEPLEE